MRSLTLLVTAVLLAACGGGDEEPPPAEWSLVFRSERSGGGDLYAWSADQPGPERLTAHPSAELHPRWVEGLEKLVFVSMADDPPGLRIQDETDLGAILLAENPGGVHPPAWSPDAAWICYPRSELGNVDLWIARGNGTDPRRLTDSAGVDDQPAWSPDGAWIAYRSRVDGQDEIFVTSPTGGDKVDVTNTPGADEAAPSWQPDGDYLLCESNDTADGLPDIFRIRVEDGRRENLTKSPGPDLSPRMRPDGGRIAFVTDRSGDWQVWTMAPDGSDQRRLTDGPGYDGEPTWVPAAAIP